MNYHPDAATWLESNAVLALSVASWSTSVYSMTRLEQGAGSPDPVHGKPGSASIDVVSQDQESGKMDILFARDSPETVLLQMELDSHLSYYGNPQLSIMTRPHKVRIVVEW